MSSNSSADAAATPSLVEGPTLSVVAVEGAMLQKHQPVAEEAATRLESLDSWVTLWPESCAENSSSKEYQTTASR